MYVYFGHFVLLLVVFIIKKYFLQICAIHYDSETIEDHHEYGMESCSANDRTGRWARVTFKVLLSYHGGSFDGWQKQPGLNTVQGYISFQSLLIFV